MFLSRRYVHCIKWRTLKHHRETCLRINPKVAFLQRLTLQSTVWHPLWPSAIPTRFYHIPIDSPPLALPSLYWHAALQVPRSTWMGHKHPCPPQIILLPRPASWWLLHLMCMQRKMPCVTSSQTLLFCVFTYAHKHIWFVCVSINAFTCLPCLFASYRSQYICIYYIGTIVNLYLLHFCICYIRHLV